MPGPRAGGPVVAAGSRRGRESGRTSPAAGPEARGRPRTRRPGVAATPVCAVPHPSPRRRPGPVRQSRRAGPRDSRRDSRRLGPGGRRTAPASRGRRSDTGPTASWADWAIHGPGVACLRTRAFRMRPGERTPAGRGGRTVRVPGYGEVRALSARREDPDGPTSAFSPVTLNDGLAKRFQSLARTRSPSRTAPGIATDGSGKARTKRNAAWAIVRLGFTRKESRSATALRPAIIDGGQ